MSTDCKRSIQVEIPLEEVEQARDRATNTIKERVRLPGFRPGKAPASIVKSRFETEIRREVLDSLLPQAFRKNVEQQGLNVVGTPDITELHFEPGQPIRFKAEFEIAPDVELGQYRGLPVKYEEPTVTDEEVDQRLEAMRDSKAEYVNLDPRPIENGDYVLIQLKSVSGLAEGIDQEAQIHVGAEDTMPGFNEALLGASPGDVKEVEITYPENYAQEKLAGKTVAFEITAKTVRKKELPALDDEFAKDLGDFQTLAELKDAVRKSIFHEKQHVAQQTAKEALIDKLVETHEFPVPEAYVNRQIETQVRMQLREVLGDSDIDLKNLNLDWEKIRETQHDKAARNVRASLLLGKVAEKEGIAATTAEVDAEVQRIAQQEREAVAVTRARLQKSGVIDRIASHIVTAKTLQMLFDAAEKHA